MKTKTERPAASKRNSAAKKQAEFGIKSTTMYDRTVDRKSAQPNTQSEHKPAILDTPSRPDAILTENQSQNIIVSSGSVIVIPDGDGSSDVSVISVDSATSDSEQSDMSSISHTSEEASDLDDDLSAHSDDGSAPEDQSSDSDISSHTSGSSQEEGAGDTSDPYLNEIAKIYEPLTNLQFRAKFVDFNFSRYNNYSRTVLETLDRDVRDLFESVGYRMYEFECRNNCRTWRGFMDSESMQDNGYRGRHRIRNPRLYIKEDAGHEFHEDAYSRRRVNMYRLVYAEPYTFPAGAQYRYGTNLHARYLHRA